MVKMNSSEWFRVTTPRVRLPLTAWERENIPHINFTDELKYVSIVLVWSEIQ